MAARCSILRAYANPSDPGSNTCERQQKKKKSLKKSLSLSNFNIPSIKSTQKTSSPPAKSVFQEQHIQGCQNKRPPHLNSEKVRISTPPTSKIQHQYNNYSRILVPENDKQ